MAEMKSRAEKYIKTKAITAPRETNKDEKWQKKGPRRKRRIERGPNMRERAIDT